MNIETNIAARAMKFKLQRGGVRRAARDKDAEEVIKNLKGDEGQIVSRKLFQNKSSLVYKYQLKASEMYQYHISQTLPCGDDATRLLKNESYFEYTGKMQQYISELDVLKRQIVGDEATYEAVITADITERNTNLYNQGKTSTAVHSDYLTYSQMCDRLYVTWYPEPISTSGDFRWEIPAEMKHRCDEQLNQMLQDAKQDIYTRMLAPMQAFIDKLAVPIGEQGSIFRDTLVENLTDLVTHLPKLNLDDDPKITEMIAALKETTDAYSGNPDILRESPGMRAKAKTDMDALLKQLTGGYKI